MSSASNRRDDILDTAVEVVGHFGLSKTSVTELAKAAGISKQGLYLHFDSKDQLIAEAMSRYFEKGLLLLDEALQRSDLSFQDRLVAALDAWFGRHLQYFNPASLQVVEPGSSAAPGVSDLKRKVCRKLEAAISTSGELARHSCSPAELARVLFQFGLTWKEGHASRASFRRTLKLCVYGLFPVLP